MDDKKPNKPIIHNVIMENRSKLHITGVTDVISFNEEIIVTDTELGMLTIQGHDLKISNLNLEDSELSVEGEFYNLDYSDKQSNKSTGWGFFSKILK